MPISESVSPPAGGIGVGWSCDGRTAAEGLAVACLALAAVLGPLALGGSGSWSRLGLETSQAAAAVLWALSAIRRPKLLALPLVVAGVACFQIVPLPAAVVARIAPAPAALWTEAVTAVGHDMAGEVAGAAARRLDGWWTLSVDPAATLAAIQRLFLGLATIAVVRDLGRQSRWRRWLTVALGISGVVIWSCGLLFPVDPRQRLLLGVVDLDGPIVAWKSPLLEPVESAGTGYPDTVTSGGLRYEADGWSTGDGFGSYIYSNHFAGGMVLTLPFLGAAALAAWRRRRLPDWVGLGMVAVLVAAGFWTTYRLAGSRAGGGGLLLAGLVLLALVACGRPQRRITATALAAVLVVLAVFLVMFFGPWLGVERVLPAALEPMLRGLRSDGRVVATRVAGWIVAGSPIVGSGLDTFGEMQPRYLGGRSVLYYAHNDYAQLLAETGLVGIVLAAALATVLGNRAVKFVRRTRTDDDPAAAVEPTIEAAAWAALAGLAIHSAFDWNLHLPAHGLIAAVVAGLAAGCRLGPDAGADVDAAACSPAVRTAGRDRLLTGVFVIVTVAGLMMLARDTRSRVVRRQLAEAITAVRIARSGPPASRSEPGLAAAIAAGERAARWDPGDARLAVMLGQAHLHRAADTGPAEPAVDGVRTAAAWFDRARLLCPASRGLATAVSRPEPAR